MKYPHNWRCTRPGEGTQDPDTGAWTPGEPTVVYDGAADCQDAGTESSRDPEGRLVLRSTSKLFLARESAAKDHQQGDVGVVTWEDGSTDDAEVSLVRYLDGTLELDWVSE